MTTFAEALRFVLAREGGFVDDPVDRGGRTNFGITQRVYDPTGRNDVKDITPREVEAIYREGYWEAGRCPALVALSKPGLALCHFDASVNHGRIQAAKFLQRAVGAVADGAIGPLTLAAVGRADESEALRSYLDQREYFYRRLAEKDPAQAKFLKGWLLRLKHLSRRLGLAWAAGMRPPA